jgi:hypothetical protein
MMVPDRLGLMCNDRYYVVRRVGRRLANLFVMLMRSLQYDVRIYTLLQSSCVRTSDPVQPRRAEVMTWHYVLTRSWY